jgi:hypothetical protein
LLLRASPVYSCCVENMSKRSAASKVEAFRTNHGRRYFRLATFSTCRSLIQGIWSFGYMFKPDLCCKRRHTWLLSRLQPFLGSKRYLGLQNSVLSFRRSGAGGVCIMCATTSIGIGSILRLTLFRFVVHQIQWYGAKAIEEVGPLYAVAHLPTTVRLMRVLNCEVRMIGVRPSVQLLGLDKTSSHWLVYWSMYGLVYQTFGVVSEDWRSVCARGTRIRLFAVLHLPCCRCGGGAKSRPPTDFKTRGHR